MILEVVLRVHEEAQMVPLGQVVLLDLVGLVEKAVLILEEDSSGVRELVLMKWSSLGRFT